MLIRAVRVICPLGGLPPLFLFTMPELYLQILENQPDFLDPFSGFVRTLQQTKKTPEGLAANRGEPKSSESPDFGLNNYKSTAIRPEVKARRDELPNLRRAGE